MISAVDIHDFFDHVDDGSRSVVTYEQQSQKRDAPNAKRSIPRNRNLASAAEAQIRNSPFVECHDINTMTPSFIYA